MKRSPSLLCLVPAIGCLVTPLYAESTTDTLTEIRDALVLGKVSASARYRYEHVDQSGFNKEANASTLRAAVGYETRSFHGLTGFMQFEGVFGVGPDNYQSIENGKTQYPRVLDTPTVEVNQAYAQYICPKDSWKTSVKFGRQEIKLANHRLIGDIAWRQDQQTFDAARVETTPYARDNRQVQVGYAYISRVNRIFPDSFATNPFDGRLAMSTHLAHAMVEQKGLGQLIGYGLLLDYDSATVAAQSSQTLGMRVNGPYKLSDELSVIYSAEMATQSDYGNNPNSYRANYYAGEAGGVWRELSAWYGYSVMEGSSTTDRFTTPLATAHAFNGWADMFTVTPASGLRAHSMSVNWAPPLIEGLTLIAQGYLFFAESNSDHYGNEIDLRAEYRVLAFSPNLLIGLKFARFVGDDTASIGGGTADSVNKAWAYSQFSF